MGETTGKKNALRAGIWYTISTISVKTILIITTPIFTRLMTTEEFGVAATFTTWYTLLNVVCSLNLWYSVGRAKLDFPGKIDEFVGSVQLLAMLFVLAVGSVSMLFIDKVSVLLDLDKPLVIALFIYLMAYPGVQLNQSKFRYIYNYKGNIAITAYTTVVTVILSVIFVLAMPEHTALGKVLGAVVATSALSAYFWVDALRKKNIRIRTDYWIYGLKISVPLIINAISLNILAQSDRIFITKYWGSGYTGIYSLAYNYAILINIFLTAINEAWLPWFHDTFNEGDFGAIRKSAVTLTMFGCWFGIGCIALGPEAIAILGGAAYSEGIWVVPPVTLGVVSAFVFREYEHIELHMKKTWYISAGTVFAAVANIVLNYIFVPKYGFVAAAYTTLACYLMLMVAHHFITGVIMKIHVYNDAFMYLSILCTGAISAVFMVLYRYAWYWRWSLITVLSLAFLYTNREVVVHSVKTFLHKK